MKIKELRTLLKDRLNDTYGRDESRAIAEYYLAETFPGSPGNIIADDELIIPTDRITLIEQDLEKLTSGMPVQYVTGKAWFYGYAFKVNQHVLIPRPETEELTELILYDYNDDNPVNILDIGTGSGCIAILLKLKKPGSTVTGTDISPGALKVAAENAIQLKTDIQLLQDDITGSKIDRHIKYDIIVSNPPYIPVGEKKSMGQHVTAYEPSQALFVPDNEPLMFYDAIMEFSQTHLTPEGTVYFEIHRDYGQQLISRLNSSGQWNAGLMQDISGNDRFIVVRRQ